MTVPGPMTKREQVRLAAAVDMIGRTGAEAYLVRFDDDTDPVAWIAEARYRGQREFGEGDDPIIATERLLENLLDGGRCTHCGRVTALIMEGDHPLRIPAICERWRIGRKYVRSCS